MQNHDTNFETNEEVEETYKLLYKYYMASLSDDHHPLSEAIFIPKHTELIVWEDKEQFVYDWHNFSHMWSTEDFSTPDEHDIRGTFHYAGTDSKQTLVNLSREPSRIKMELNSLVEHSEWPIGKEPTCSWVKLYEKLTYIPQLQKNIIGYMVWEVDVPTVTECFKYSKQHGTDIPFNTVYTTKSNPIIYTPNTPPNGLGNNYTGTITYPTVFNNPAYNTWLKDNNINPIQQMKWTCQICGGDTSQVEYDYLGSGTNHLQCELQQQMPNKFALEN